ncbi:LacI family DNA-binding transcriptional regulator [Nocardioides lianchengensis]|uniref:LacI family transcriptional regulator n=1 Tax=Nocardioides lianchengensis TaxID=1045774 RepID=A0A1G7AHA9_9ACTN|nr:LacI family DNA-binding transcriptional regulator [Nocardioides lianchengensis]NYG13576.1 LacI family transcriptional regulator [Nocardioides lianchengensis]SDE14189.1 LacI family transcriptional regulator [Nocardioides lianchengensis]
MKRSLAQTRLVDVAAAAGVSIATASRSLSGTPGVSPAVADRVRQIAVELGYVANLHARSLASGSTATIGLVVHEIGDPYFSEIASGVLRVAASEGRTVQICHTGRDPDAELQQIRSMVANRVGAIIVAGSGFVDPTVELPARHELERFSEAGGRVAVIGRHHLGVDAVLPENVEGGRAVTEHVLGLGHRRIAVLAGSTALTTVADRLSGVHEALVEAGLDPSEVPVVEAAFTREGGREGARRVLAEHPDTTAVVALNDDMAIGCLSELRVAGVPVPTRMSVTGFDDVAVAGDLSPGLTTVRLPMVDMGARALALALKEPGKRPRRQRIPATLVVRDSTGPVPG